MGYTTEFKGRFIFDKLPSSQSIATLRQLEGNSGSPNAPDSYCDWQLTKDCMGLEWSGAEKFYHYVEWLQWLYDNILKKDGIQITGALKYEGESSDDMGSIIFENGKFIQRKECVVGDEAVELLAFRDFVLKSDYSEELIEAWKRRRK